METFIELKELVENPHYQVQRHKSLDDLTDNMIDVPIIDLINGLNRLSYCFTLQSCYGHFICHGQQDAQNFEPLPVNDTVSDVEYRIAYIAFCIENSLLGRGLFAALQGITAIDPENIQFCCAEWFWQRQVNSYVLQVEPVRFKRNDKVMLDYKESLHIEKVRDEFFSGLMNCLKLQGTAVLTGNLGRKVVPPNMLRNSMSPAT